MAVTTLTVDLVVNGVRQSVQFFIFSHEYAKIADAINVAKAVIKQTEAKQLKIDKVLLIGGSSQLTLVRQMLTEALPTATIDTCGEKDIAVALENVFQYGSHGVSFLKEHYCFSNNQALQVFKTKI